MLQSERLILRQIGRNDYTYIKKIYCKAENMKFILNGKCNWTLQEVKDKWAKDKFDPKSGIGFLIVINKQTNEVIGECGVLSVKGSNEYFEIAYLVDESFWNMGFGSEICNLVLKYGFHVLNADKMYAEMYQENFRSSKLVKKLGFELKNQGKTKTGIKFTRYELSKVGYLKNGAP